MPVITRVAANSVKQPAELPPEAYRQAVDQADLAISITDPKANILFANDAFARVTGYATDELVGKNQSMLSSQTTSSDTYRRMWSELAAQRACSGRLLNRKKNGLVYLAELTISPIVDAQGKTTHFLGTHRDVTELHRLERVVGNQKKLIESVVDAAPMAFALLDQSGRVILDNHEYKKLLTSMGGNEPAHTLLASLSPNWRESLSSRPESEHRPPSRPAPLAIGHHVADRNAE
ncbi:PAS protein (fragment) [Candidatus Accumulibacter aalborgensis]|uniref:PAS protein n=1 Tax=Candidatus Accumulibacter aalborgensis TaxID=1860102 RepID=A0A1A8XPX3_9PROT